MFGSKQAVDIAILFSFVLIVVNLLICLKRKPSLGTHLAYASIKRCYLLVVER